MLALRFITVLGGPVVRAGLVVQTCLALLLWKRWRPALFMGATVGATSGLNTGIKKLVDRRRPRSIVCLRPNDESFPSGHASGVTALAGAGAYVLWLLTGRMPVSAVAALMGAITAAAVGYSRVSLNRHHTSDVLAGHALGLACLAGAIAVDRRVSASLRPAMDVPPDTGS
jgi:membrane-associated phospholipid phosphatase